MYERDRPLVWNMCTDADHEPKPKKMKFHVFSIIAAIGLSSAVSAQYHQISLGADVGIPFGDMEEEGGSLILGPTLGYEFPAGQVGITAQVGYSLVFMKDDAPYRGWNMIPAHLGIKYYFTEPQLGMYIHGQGGIHSMIREFGEVDHTIVAGVNDTAATTVTLPTVDVTYTAFSYALGIGYQMENLDVSLRYQGIGADDRDGVQVQVPGFDNQHITYPSSPAYSYIGIRIAYLFNLGRGATASTTTP